MIISQARIKLSNESCPDAPLPSVIVLENEDKLVDCTIERGEIIARKGVHFKYCLIMLAKDETLTLLDESLPRPMPMVTSCRLLDTKLPDAYYSDCFVETHSCENVK